MKGKSLLSIDPYRIFNIKPKQFESLALEVFQYQQNHNPIYKAFVEALGIDDRLVQSLNEIPLMPVEFFKNFEIKTGKFTPEITFLSSGTTGMSRSKHLIKDVHFYKASFLGCFEHFFGQIDDFLILAFLPNYIEQGHSSLVHMMSEMINQSKNTDSGFYDHKENKWMDVLDRNSGHKKILIFGVSFALLDISENLNKQINSNIILMETGGMKGRRKEIVREELHEKLKESFGLKNICSEYGMTEIMSQAYSKGDGIFNCAPWMKVLTKSITDPFENQFGNRGKIGIIDLANIHSCSFIQTHDLGKVYPSGRFEIIGRADNSDLRGCNLMY